MPNLKGIDGCSIDGCLRKAYSRTADPRGLCRHHHGLLRRFGDVNAGEVAMLYALVDRREADDCWEWLGARLPNGYGYFHNKYPHRMAWEFEHGPIADGLQIDHRCHNLVCVNPSHLRVVTQNQNMENRAGAQKNNRVGIRGVTLVQGRYKARVRQGGTDYYLGTFDSPGEAAEVARLKRLELFTHNDIDRLAV